MTCSLPFASTRRCAVRAFLDAAAELSAETGEPRSWFVDYLSEGLDHFIAERKQPRNYSLFYFTEFRDFFISQKTDGNITV
jgi:hypothetical protein